MNDFKVKRIFICFLIIFCLFIERNVISIVYGNEFENSKVSFWAVEEINKARELGIISGIHAYEDYSKNITRNDFTIMALNFVIFQFGYFDDNIDSNFDNNFKAYCRKIENNLDLNLINVNEKRFFDVLEEYERDISLAYDLGIISGKSETLFEPDSFITREEAAVLLNNVYDVYSNSVKSVSIDKIDFKDIENISDWAISGVNYMSSLEVIQGDENGNFNPKDNFTIEQAIIMFTRLYKNAEYSAFKNNVAPFFNYQDIKQEIIDGNSRILGEPYTDYLTLENDQYFVLAADYGLWAMKGHGNIYIIDKLGGLKIVGLDVYISYIQLLDFQDDTNIVTLCIKEHRDAEEYTPYTLNLLSGELIKF